MFDEVTVRVARLWLGDDGIFRIVHFPGSEVSLADAQETMDAYLRLRDGVSRPLLVDTQGMKSLDRPARAMYASEEAARVATAVAIIVDTPVSRVLGNFYIGLANPHIPSQLFSGQDEALEWLKRFLL
ncbi:MAG: hypothetical protein HY828_14745 [Actinobacteria bacterium]|nr:hypothetical protein [Actinomycetota bacterium]